MGSLIECEDVWKVYRVGDMEVQALRGLSLTIEQGEFVAIMGSSGSGKSTLMNILGCLDQPTKGHYRLNGIEVGNLKPDQLAGYPQPADWVRLSELQSHSQNQRARKCAAPAVLSRALAQRATGAGRSGVRAGGAAGQRAPLSNPVVRRAAAARGDCAGAGYVTLVAPCR